MPRGYWRYDYYPPAKPRPVKGGIKAKSQRGAIGETWWSKRWIGVLESFHMGARLTRGRTYARKGQVISIDVQSGVVKAKVQGTRAKPYSVTIRLQPLADPDWDKVSDAMASQAIFAAKLLSGEMPQNIEDAFSEVNLSLFPTSREELDTECSCPDWANPCKHIAAVYYLLAERFDEDPFLIFKLRGRTKDEIIKVLREKRAETLPAESASPFTGAGLTPDEKILPLEECLDTFWLPGKALDAFVVRPAAPKVDHAILKRLGEAPFAIGSHNIASLLSKAYGAASAAALQKASEESREPETK
ncbi:MAG: SWIM zinc finger family protein [Candidatus Bipolaricaulia bacterium]